jgi:hypothetical protein
MAITTKGAFLSFGIAANHDLEHLANARPALHFEQKGLHSE